MGGESVAENLGGKHSGVSGVTENFSHFFVIFLQMVSKVPGHAKSVKEGTGVGL